MAILLLLLCSATWWWWGGVLCVWVFLYMYTHASVWMCSGSGEAPDAVHR